MFFKAPESTSKVLVKDKEEKQQPQKDKAEVDGPVADGSQESKADKRKSSEG